MKPQARLLLACEQGCDHALDVGASDPSVGAGEGAGHLSAVAEADDALQSTAAEQTEGQMASMLTS